MSIKDISEGIEKKKVFFGIKQVLKKPKAKTKKAKVFVARDSREDTIKKLEEAEINFEVLNKNKEEIAKELNLNFESEVFSLR